jgi:hypothetical protein
VGKVREDRAVVIAVSRGHEPTSRINADPDHADNQERTGKHGTGKVEIVARAVWQAPPHAGKNMEFLGDVSGHYDR